MRIGFLFNHDQIHQVAHSLPIAMALAGSGHGGEIIVATTNDWLAREVSRTVAPLAPAAKVLVYGDNLDFFRSLHVLVVAEKTSLVLRRKYGLTNPLLIHTRHYAVGRGLC